MNIMKSEPKSSTFGSKDHKKRSKLTLAKSAHQAGEKGFQLASLALPLAPASPLTARQLIASVDAFADQIPARLHEIVYLLISARLNRNEDGAAA